MIVVALSGAIDDAADLDQVIGPLPQGLNELHVNLAEINRINSVGVKGWIKYFQKIRPLMAQIVFWDASLPIVQQLNSVSNFSCGAKTGSLKVPFACDACSHNFQKTMTSAQVANFRFEIPDEKCPKCGGAAPFDDLPKVYFKFLMSR